MLYVGDSVQISVNVTNVGDLIGNDSIPFEINGAVKDIENLTLTPSDSQVAQFNDVETKEGNYSVTVGSLNENFTINSSST